jgi:hypothetical protein
MLHTLEYGGKIKQLILKILEIKKQQTTLLQPIKPQIINFKYNKKLRTLPEGERVLM